MDTPAEASRRSFLRMAGAGVAGTLGAGAIAGTAVGVERYHDIVSARRRGDGATVATLSSASSLEGILAGAHQAGYEFVTVSEMFELDNAGPAA